MTHLHRISGEGRCHLGNLAVQVLSAAADLGVSVWCFAYIFIYMIDLIEKSYLQL